MKRLLNRMKCAINKHQYGDWVPYELMGVAMLKRTCRVCPATDVDPWP